MTISSVISKHPTIPSLLHNRLTCTLFWMMVWKPWNSASIEVDLPKSCYWNFCALAAADSERFGSTVALQDSSPPGSPSLSDILNRLKEIAVDLQDGETSTVTTQATELKESRAAIRNMETKIDATDM